MILQHVYMSYVGFFNIELTITILRV